MGERSSGTGVEMAVRARGTVEKPTVSHFTIGESPGRLQQTWLQKQQQVMRRRPWWLVLGLVVLQATLYFLAARLLLSLTSSRISRVALFWCGNGITFVFLLFSPYWEWPLYMVGVVAGLFAARVGVTPPLLTLQLGLCNCVEVLVGGALLKWKLHALVRLLVGGLLLKWKLHALVRDPLYACHERFLVWLVVIMVVAPAAAAVPAAFALNASFLTGSWVHFYLSWAFADSSGSYITFYLIMVMRMAIFEETGSGIPSLHLFPALRNRVHQLNRKQLLHIFEYVACLFIMGFIFLSNLVPVASLLMFPLQGWVALRFSQLASALMDAWVSLAVVLSVMEGRAIWLNGDGDHPEPTIEMMIFMHTVLFLSVLTTQMMSFMHAALFLSVLTAQFVSTNIQAKKHALRDSKKRALRDMKRTVAEKQAFFQHISHEFRTPLSVIIGFCEALEMGDLTPQQKDQVRCMSSAGSMLSMIVDDLLELFRMEVGRATLNMQDTCLRPFFEDCCRGIQQYASFKPQLQVTYHVGAGVPERVKIDFTRAQQILYNLGSNAVKYSKEGRVTLSLTLKDPRRSGVTAAVTAADGAAASGAKGGDASLRPAPQRQWGWQRRLIAPLAAAGCDSGGGSGGGGDCGDRWADGSEPHAKPPLPIAWRRRQRWRSAAAADAAALAALLARGASSKRTSGGGGGGGAWCCGGGAAGAHPLHALGVESGGGEDAVTQASAWDGDCERGGSDAAPEPRRPPPQTVLLRLQVADTGIGIPTDALPAIFERFNRCKGHANETMAHGTGLGLSVTKQVGQLLVESTLGRGSTFTVIFPAEVVEQCDSSGGSGGGGSAPVASCAGAREALCAPLPALAALPSQLPPPPPAAASARGEVLLGDGQAVPLQVLVVEDSVLNQRLLDSMLRRMGHAPTIVSDGAAAVTAATSSHAVFDLVLLDLGLPLLDGYGVMRAVRACALPPQSDVPIVIISARAMEDNALQECRSAGADGFATKPFTARSLGAEIARLMDCGRLQRRAPTAVGAAAHSSSGSGALHQKPQRSADSSSSAHHHHHHRSSSSSGGGACTGGGGGAHRSSGSAALNGSAAAAPRGSGGAAVADYYAGLKLQHGSELEWPVTQLPSDAEPLAAPSAAAAAAAPPARRAGLRRCRCCGGTANLL
ncbi:hypothetical protein JKP88DRAFT_335547 [Tribonema minus]|uniref:histidine kinase n=1 Tax=Tribonema minus TaxID=303371 RepID=A0A836C8Y7_9STRA|nr:hypothetical protein JKP88DRAFT_335547 [Tribonema minus]